MEVLDELFKAMTSFAVDLHPSQLLDIEEGVRDRLNQELLSYNEALEGVILSINSLRVASKLASVRPYVPFIHLNVEAEVTLFKPKVGTCTVGMVNKVGADYLGVLVLGVFNGAITAENISKDFKCDLKAGMWVSQRDPEHQVQVGTMVRFLVQGLNNHSGLFSLVGSMKERGTGAVEFLKRKKKKKKKKKEEEEEARREQDPAGISNGTKGKRRNHVMQEPGKSPGRDEDKVRKAKRRRKEIVVDGGE